MQRRAVHLNRELTGRTAAATPARVFGPPCFGGHPLPQRGGEHRGVRAPRAVRPGRERARRRGDRRRQRLGGRQRRARPRGRRHGRRRAAARVRQAYLAGFAAARGDYIVMIDADLTYDFEEIPRFVEQLDDGAELVMGNRMKNIEPGAMSLAEPHRQPDPLRLPQPALPNADRRRPLRAARGPPRRAAALDLHSTGMEFASEMVIRAARGTARHPRAADRAAPARRRVEALAVPRRLAAPPPDARLQPRLPLPRPRRGDGRPRAPDRHPRSCRS